MKDVGDRKITRNMVIFTFLLGNHLFIALIFRLILAVPVEIKDIWCMYMSSRHAC
jgi:hypothetical protein